MPLSHRDFLAMKSCPYIMFGTIARSYSIGTVRNNMTTAIVWRREILSETLGMTESQFIEWVLLIGNDYTKHFYLSSTFSPYLGDDLVACGDPETCCGDPRIELQNWQLADRNRLSKLRDFILSKDPDFLLTSALEDLEAALLYSRGLYNLENIKEYDVKGPQKSIAVEVQEGAEFIKDAVFHDDICADKIGFEYSKQNRNIEDATAQVLNNVSEDDISENEEAESCQEDYSYHLTYAQREAFNTYIELNIPASVCSCDIGDYIILFLRSFIREEGQFVNHVDAERSGYQSAETDDIVTLLSEKDLPLSENFFSDIKTSQLNALSSMLRKISLNMVELRKEEMKFLSTKLLSNMSMVPYVTEDGKVGDRANHIQGIAEDIDCLRKSDAKSTSTYLNIKFENVRAAHTYQLLCKHLIGRRKGSKWLLDVSNVHIFCSFQGLWINFLVSLVYQNEFFHFLFSPFQFQPRYVYDGNLFHRAVGGIEIFALSRQKSDEVKIERKVDTVTFPSTSHVSCKSSLIFQQQDPKSLQSDAGCIEKHSGIDDNQKSQDSTKSIITKSDEIIEMAPLGNESTRTKFVKLELAKNENKATKNRVKKVESCMDAIRRAFEKGINDPRVTLPIDEHKHEILSRIDRDRVTIIHGETGCGKSTRVPVMLLEDADLKGIPCRMMVRDIISYPNPTI